MLSTELHSRMLLFSTRLYRWMLLAYPHDLRSEFGCEIAETFDLQLSEGWRSKRVRGVICVWLQAILEFCTIAVAYWLKLLMTPCIATATTAIVFSALMAMPIPLALDFGSTNKPWPILVTRFGGSADSCIGSLNRDSNTDNPSAGWGCKRDPRNTAPSTWPENVPTLLASPHGPLPD